MQKNWSDLQSVISAMEKCGKCIILRNFEELSDEHYYMDGHEDIDFLCEDSAKVRKVLDAVPNVPWGSQDHVFVRIAGKKIKFGLRYVGDGYYCDEWERKMLADRVLYKGKFYVMNPADYFYSLLFHALFQKRKLSDDYRSRLKEMGRTFGIELDDEESFYKVIIEYLKNNRYVVEYPKDVTVSVNYKKIPPCYLRGRLGYFFRFFCGKLIMKTKTTIYKLTVRK